VEQTARHLAERYGYQELRTPLIEDAALFLRSVGDTTDIVQKEMFRLRLDGDGPEIALRPEGTASVVRAYVERHLHKVQGFAKLFYLGPMFRAERPQAGRRRQFHQVGVEAIGSDSPWVDVEVILLCLHILRACGVTKTAVLLSSMGCRTDQAATAHALRQALDRTQLCKDCQDRCDRNIFRVVDCKHPQCHTFVHRAIATLEAPRDAAARREPRPGYVPALFQLCEECRPHFNEVCRGLESAGVRFDHTTVFARGLDYYTRTVFEVRAEGLGAQDAVAAGGRYDHLVEDLGGPPMGAVGFAAGIERIRLAQEAQGKASQEPPPRRGLYLALAQPALIGQGVRLAQQAREQGIYTLMDYEGKSLKAQLREADGFGCRFVALLGEREAAQRMVTLKDLERGTQTTVAWEQLVDAVAHPSGDSPGERGRWPRSGQRVTPPENGGDAPEGGRGGPPPARGAAPGEGAA
jgi:histidyl-tRNA synthetase